MTEQERFNEAYWLSFPPEVRALRDIAGGSEERRKAAQDLAETAKYPLDRAIHFFGRDPWITMLEREFYGYKWTPAFWQNPPAWDINGWSPMKDAAYAPPGSTKVSSKAEDYKPFDVPKPPPVVENNASPSDEYWLPTRRAARTNDTSPDGTIYQSPDGKTWLKVVRPGPFGGSWWELKP